jgi:AcrR family transcriptional regulator
MARAGVDATTVVAEAAELADRDGLDSVTLKRLADAVGVRPPSLYAHVDGIDDVRRRLGALGARELARELGQAVEGRSGLHALRALAHAYRDYARRHPGRYAALQRARDLQGDPDSDAAALEAVRVALAALRDYGLEGDDAVHAVRLVRVALHGFVSLEVEGGFAMELSADDTFDRLIGLLDLGLRAGA